MNEVKYPCLMKNSITGLIVMMESSGVGTVVGTGNGSSGRKVGSAFTTWTMLYFKPYKGDVCVTNN